MRIARWLWALLALPAVAAAQGVQTVHTFEAVPSSPRGGLVEGADGALYGTTAVGRTGGTIFRVPAGGGPLTIVRAFDRGGYPAVSMVRGAGGLLYGTTRVGGDAERGTVYRFDPATGALTTLHAFTGPREGWPPDGVIQASDGLLYGVDSVGYFRLDPVTGRVQPLIAFPVGAPPAEDLGDFPVGRLTESPQGFLYGVLAYGGPGQGGTVVKLNRATGAVTRVHAFSTESGPANPTGGLTLTHDGLLYGVTRNNGFGGAGAVYRIDPATDTFQVAYQLTPANGDPARPMSRLVEAADGSLFGTAESGPAVDSGGAIFRLIRQSGVGHTCALVADFDRPSEGSGLLADLAIASDGWVYGSATADGPGGGGTVFRFDSLFRGAPADPAQFAVVHAFARHGAGVRPRQPPVAHPDGYLYGTTAEGGAGSGVVYRLDPATGATTSLGDVPNPAPGVTAPTHSRVVAGPDGALYFTAVDATATPMGRIYRATTTGPVTLAANYPSPSVGIVGGAGLVRSGTSLYGLIQSDGLKLFRYVPGAPDVTIVTTVHPVVSPLNADLLAVAGERIYVAIATVFFIPRFTPVYQTVLVRVDLPTAAATTIVTVPGGLRTSSPAQGPDGTIYLAGAGEVVGVDPATGMTHTACATGGYQIDAITAAPDGSLLVVTPTYITGRIHRCVTDGATPRLVHDFAQRDGYIAGGLSPAPRGVFYGAADGGSYSGGSIFRLTIGDPLPLLDGDGDGLDTTWESTLGLDPASAAGDDGASGDPDGDGRTNAEEMAAGTHPQGHHVRYLAEGAANAFFRTRIAVLNRGTDTAHVLLRFLTDAGVRRSQALAVPALSRRAVDAADVPDLSGTSFSTVIESDLEVTVDRTMTWDTRGYGSHVETAIAAPSTTWYFAEGSTSGEFALFYLLQNPQASSVTATIRYLRPFGLPPIERSHTIAPLSRLTVPVDSQGAELASTDISAVVTAAAPIIAERAMYLSRPGQAFAAGHESAGVTAPGLDWFLAEGATGTFFDLFVLLANPNATPATVQVDYLRPSGPVLTKTYNVPAQGRVTIWVDDEQLPAGSGQRPLASTPVSIIVHATNGVPIVVERTMWWPGPETTPDFWYEAHNAAGSTGTALRWAIAEAEVGGPDYAETYVLIANTAATPGRVLVRAVFEDGNTTGRFVDLPPLSRTNVALGVEFVEAVEHGRASVIVDSVATAVPAVPIVVEHATYASPGAVVWARGSNALADPLP